jgi:16S rRNA processing protein RimM
MASPRPAVSHGSRQPATPDTQVSSAVEGLASPATPPTAREEEGPSERSRPSWVLLAKLVRPHGRRGELIAEILTDFPERFHERPRLFLIPPERLGSRPREVQLENFWFLRSRIVMKFQGVDSINEAEALRGFEVAIPSSERALLPAGSVYVSDLIGCRVVDLDRDSAAVGEIVEVDRDSSSTELLVVRRRDRPRGDQEVLIPFVAKYVVRVDAANRVVEMRLPEGLLEINAPMSEEEKREAGEQTTR